MITEQDIEFMKQSRRELIANRTSKIIVKYWDVIERDPFTDEPILEDEVAKEVDAVVTELSAGEERMLVGGIEIQDGDIRVSISIELIDKAEALLYDGREYEVLAMDKKGIGERNRYEILARLKK